MCAGKRAEIADGRSEKLKIKQLRLIKFKRFDDLTIDLGEHPAKIVALIGPNGSGKSSVFDAFEQVLQQVVSAAGQNQPESYYSKQWYDAENPSKIYRLHDSIKLDTLEGKSFPDEQFLPKNFYVRSAYRYTPSLRVNAIQKVGDMITDTNRPGSTAGLDQRLQRNYERMQGQLLSAFWGGKKTGEQTRNELVDEINARLNRVLDISISELGNVAEGDGQLFFKKGTSLNFPFENLSAGEKEVVDILIDMQVKTKEFDDTVYCIDEPEIHLNTAVQRRLLLEIADMIGERSQLWIATHSVGFLRALQVDLANKSQVLDFSGGNYFDGAATIGPMVRTRRNWQRVFSTALEDITGLIAPERIVYCEGRPDPGGNGTEQGLDARVYNDIFETTHPETMFVSSGGGGEQVRNAGLALTVLSKALNEVEFLLLKDRDDASNAQRDAFLAVSQHNRMLTRREVENYLFDEEVLRNYCLGNNVEFDEARYRATVNDVRNQDLKVGQTSQHVAASCSYVGSIAVFKERLSRFLTPDLGVYRELEGEVFDVAAESEVAA